MSSLEPIVNQPFLYVNNLQLEWASTTTLTVGAGQARDSTNSYDIVLGTSATINGAVNGVNGLDTGSLANNTFYYVFAIGDQFNFFNGATIISASTTPTMPFGYNAFRLIGYVQTDGSAHFLKFYTSGNGNYRYHVWDTVISVLSAGTATALTNISLAAAVPPIDFTPVQIEANYVPNAAGDEVSFAPFGSTATTLPHLVGVVATKANSGQFKIVSRLNTATPTILYINSAASGSSSVWVSGFEYFI